MSSGVNTGVVQQFLMSFVAVDRALAFNYPRTLLKDAVALFAFAVCRAPEEPLSNEVMPGCVGPPFDGWTGVGCQQSGEGDNRKRASRSTTATADRYHAPTAAPA